MSGDNSKNPFAPPRKKNFPMPAFEFNKEAKVVAAAAERMGLHSQFQCCAIQCLIMGAPHVFATALAAAMRARWMQRMERKTRLFQKR